MIIVVSLASKWKLGHNQFICIPKPAVRKYSNGIHTEWAPVNSRELYTQMIRIYKPTRQACRPFKKGIKLLNRIAGMGGTLAVQRKVNWNIMTVQRKETGSLADSLIASIQINRKYVYSKSG